MAVVGIDFGNLNCVIAQAEKGGVKVILNASSNRLNPNIVSFQEKQRFMSDSAATMKTSNYRNTIFNMKRLGGLPFNSPDLQEELSQCPFKGVETEKGTCGFSVYYNDEQTTVTPEQCTAMMLTQLNEVVKGNTNGAGIADCVISVPPWFTIKQKKAILDACQIAGVNCLRLLHETTATALHYGAFKTLNKEFKDDEDTNFLFIDLGQSSFTASVVAFRNGSAQVKSCVWDRKLGGRDFDKVIMNMAADVFQKKYGMDPRTNPKATIKLLAAAEKTKKTLSPAGVTQAQISVESLMEGIDLTTMIKLDDFNEGCVPLLDRLEPVINGALAQAGITVEDCASVEIVGGATRVNCVKLRMAEILKTDRTRLNYGLGTSMNADEAIACGCALNSAMLSSRFGGVLKKFKLYEAVSYPVKVSWESSTPMEEQVEASDENSGEEMTSVATSNSLVVFPKLSKSPLSRHISFKVDSDLKVRVEYDEESCKDILPSGTDMNLVSYNIAMPTSGNGGKVPVRVTLSHDVNGIVSVTSAQLMEEIIEEERPKEPDSAEGKEGDEKTTEDSKEAPVSPKKEEGPKKKKYKKVDLKFDHAFAYGMTGEEMKEAIEKEAKMTNLDREIKETSDRRNDLETYVYAMRDSIGSLSEYITPEEKAAFEKVLEDTSNWLYEDGFDATKSVYINKLADIRKTGDIAERRKIEWTGRPQSIADMKRVIEDHVKILNSTDEKYAHIEADERAKCKTTIDNANTWLYEMLDKQGALKACEDPVLTLFMLKEERNKLDATCRKIMNKPKPAPPKKEEEKKTETTTGNENNEPNEEKAQEPVVEGDADPDAQNMDVDESNSNEKTDDSKMDTSSD